MENKPDFVQKLTIGNAEHELRITGVDDKYKLELAPPVGGQQSWMILGQQSDPVMRETLLLLEVNWQRGTLPVTNTDEYFRAMQMLAEAQVGELADKLVQNGFPSEAVPAFKEFAVREFAVQIGVTINFYWDKKRKTEQEPDLISDVSIDGIPFQLQITGAQKMEYKFEFVPNPPYPDETGETQAKMIFAAGLCKRRIWTAKGPFDQESRRDLFGILEDNWQRETLPNEKQKKMLRKVIRKLTEFYVDPIIDQLKQESFPADAIPIVRQFAEEDYSFTIGLTIGDFWEEKQTG